MFLKSVCVAAAFLAFGPAVLAQDEEPDAIELLRAADRALSEASGLQFEAVAEGVGALAARSPRIEAKVRVERIEGSDASGWRLGAEGTAFAAGADGSVPFGASYDGKVFRSLRGTERAVVEGTGAEAKALLDDGAGWVLGWLVRWNELVTQPFVGDEASSEARYEGVTEVGGARCHVVYADYSELADPRLYGAWWFLSVDDSLPRRVEMHYLDDEFGDGFARVTLTGLTIGEAGADGGPSFALALPEGYELKKHEPPAQAKPRERPQQQKVAVGAAAPEFALKDVSGKLHALSDYKGKVVVLDFWATWCPPCRAAMPGVQRLHEKFKGKGVAVFGVNCWENGDPEGYMKEQRFTYGLLLNGDDVAQAYGVTGIPVFVVIGKDGKVLSYTSGFDPTGAVEKNIEKAIDEQLKVGG